MNSTMLKHKGDLTKKGSTHTPFMDPIQILIQ